MAQCLFDSYKEYAILRVLSRIPPRWDKVQQQFENQMTLNKSVWSGTA
uniref:Uncharacterized protein n=1 Tax=Anguilla anguilla TaxID=7936 RepID=A0A0E9XBB0_ANGAN